MILDYNEKNEVVGVEMLYLSKRTPNLKTTALEFESVQVRQVGAQAAFIVSSEILRDQMG